MAGVVDSKTVQPQDLFVIGHVQTSYNRFASSSPCMVGDASQILLLKGQISSFLIYIFLPQFTLNPSGNLSACINFYYCAVVISNDK